MSERVPLWYWALSLLKVVLAIVTAPLWVPLLVFALLWDNIDAAVLEPVRESWRARCFKRSQQ